MENLQRELVDIIVPHIQSVKVRATQRTGYPDVKGEHGYVHYDDARPAAEKAASAIIQKRFPDSCLMGLKADEPFFVLRAQDLFAPDLIRLWAEKALHGDGEGGGIPAEKYQEALDIAQQMEDWPHRKYPD